MVLADGIDPLTGEVLPKDHVCNKGEIVRALHCAVEELSHRQKKRCLKTMESLGRKNLMTSYAACSMAV